MYPLHHRTMHRTSGSNLGRLRCGSGYHHGMRFGVMVAAFAVLTCSTAWAVSAGSRHYEGTGDRRDFTVVLGRHAHSTEYEVGFFAPCKDSDAEEHAGYGTDATPGERPLHVGRHGRFHMHRHFRNNWGTVWDIRFAGRFRHRRASGTFRATSDTPAETGPGTIHCATGPVRWTARRK